MRDKQIKINETRHVAFIFAGNVGPHAAVEKPFLLSDGRVGLEAKLDRAIYAHGDSITVHVYVSNNSSKSVRRLKVYDFMYFHSFSLSFTSNI